VIVVGYKGLDIINEELNELEHFIEKNINSPQLLISSAVKDLASAGGKRIRPALTILIGKALGQKKQKLIPIAASMEIIHMATLVHDDIVDDAGVRRGRPTVQSRYGKDVAVFTGDYLFSKAFLVISQYADKESLKWFAYAIKRICEGEIEQYENRYSLNLSLLKYMRRIRRKTGVLLALSCMAGMPGRRLNIKLMRGLSSYGMNLGLAFQINDDILDYVGEESTVGKPVGSDIRQGVYTLPLIYAAGHSKRKDELVGILKKEAYSEEDISTVINIVRESGGIEYSKRLAERYVSKGLESIGFLKDNMYKKALTDLIVDLNKRNY
jgi:heptaprenyl diphosphate synthase